MNVEGRIEQEWAEKLAQRRATEQDRYDWVWQICGVFGVLTRLADGATLGMNGDEANEFDEQWESCEDPWARNTLASAYDDVMEVEDEG